MTVLESMKKALETIRYYDTEAEGLTAELRAYTDELERAYTDIEPVILDRFISTASADGLREYEEMFGPARDDLSLSERRRLLTLRMNLGKGDFTPAGIRQALDSFGLDYVISEAPAFYRLSIMAQSDYTEAQQSYIVREVGRIVPAHIEYQMVFNTLSWDELDARDKTFAALDEDNLTWEQIDALS